MSKAAVVYEIGWSDPNAHLYDVVIRFEARSRVSTLQLPVWRPGRYLIQNYAANVREWSAKANGVDAQLVKSGKSEWQIHAARGAEVEVRYRFFAGVLDAGSSFLDETEAYFNGSNLFMLVVGRRDEPCHVRVRVPRGWDVATQLRRRQGSTFEARDYDHLIDSPFIVSRSMRIGTERVGGKTIRFVFHEPGELDIAALARSVAPALAQQVALFGELPAERYTFLYHLGNVWHGVEHEDSSSIILKRAAMAAAVEGSDAHDHFLSITAHEFFHLWNVKRILPTAFDPYDYSRETPTRLLWAMEGVTSYFGDLSLARSGSWSVERYLRHLSEEIEVLEDSPARSWLSLAQASFDGWLQEPAQMHDRSNGAISFYTKGELVAALLDLSILDETDGRHSLDDVMRLLWKEHGRKRRGVPEDGFERAAATVAGPGIVPFFRRFVDGTDPLPYDRFAIAGVKAVRTEVPQSPWKLSVKGGRVVIERIVPNSAAERCGLIAGDEIIAIDGTRVGDPAAADLIVERAAAVDGEILFSRAGRVERRVMKLQKGSRVETTLKIDRKADERALRLRRRWLGEQE